MKSKSVIDTRIFLKLLKSATPYRFLFVSALLLTIVYAAVSAVRPLLIGKLVSKFVGEDYESTALFNWTIFLIVLLFLEAVLQFLSSYLSSVLGQRIIRDLRKRLFEHVVGFRRKFFDKTPIGSLVTRVVSDIHAFWCFGIDALYQLAADRSYADSIPALVHGYSNFCACDEAIIHVGAAGSKSFEYFCPRAYYGHVDSTIVQSSAARNGAI
jgi:ABC-type transport system involved in cytochrome bd biosynthesis fused ATPase/permease subunit